MVQLSAEDLISLALGPFVVGLGLGFGFSVFAGVVFYALGVVRHGWSGRG